MTPSPHISKNQVRRPHWLRSYRPSLGDEPVIRDPSDIDTVSFEGNAGDRPTSSFETARPRTPSADAAIESPIPQELNQQPEGPVALREIGPGSVLRGRYLIEKAIGVGGTSTVFSALDRHRSSARANGHSSEQGSRLNGFGRIAVKVLRTETGANDARVFRMEREFRQMQRLTHTGIVRVFDLDCEDDVWFITMELLEGQPLHRYLRTGLKDTEALRILTQCAEALAYAHDQGIVHGDLKPGNVFITHDGSVRLFDFGSAPDLAEAAAEPTAAHRFAATPPYASPETLEGKGVDERDEVFSLGCLAYELLSGGQHPFDRKSSLEARQQNLRPQPVDSIRPRHFATISKALSWDRTERPASAREFLQALLAPESSRDANAALSTSTAAAGVSMPADVPATPRKAAAIFESAPTVEFHARTPSEQTDPVENASTDAVAEKSVAAPEPRAYEEVSVEWTPPPVEQHGFATEQVGGTESVAKEPATAEPSPLSDLDDTPRRKFAGFVPSEMLTKPKRNPEPPRRVDLHVAGLSRSSPWIKRSLLIALLAVALLAGYFVLGRHMPAATAVSVAPPVVAPAEARNAEPELAPSAPLAETITPVEAPLPATPAVIRSAPGEVSFESATVNVSAAQSMAVVNIARLKSTRGAVPIKWSTVGDTAQPGVHYESVDSKITRFNDGQSVRSLFIQLKNDPSEASRPARSFIVKLEKAAGGPALGAITQARVIVGGIE